MQSLAFVSVQVLIREIERKREFWVNFCKTKKKKNNKINKFNYNKHTNQQTNSFFILSLKRLLLPRALLPLVLSPANINRRKPTSNAKWRPNLTPTQTTAMKHLHLHQRQVPATKQDKRRVTQLQLQLVTHQSKNTKNQT